MGNVLFSMDKLALCAKNRYVSAVKENDSFILKLESHDKDYYIQRVEKN